MMGCGNAVDEELPPECHGLIPRICAGLFDRIEVNDTRLQLPVLTYQSGNIRAICIESL